jgi:hypothetical protein
MHKQLTKGEQETCVLRETLRVELPSSRNGPSEWLQQFPSPNQDRPL